VGLDAHALRAAHPRLDVVPFESHTMHMATLDGGDAPAVHVKGGVEQVLARCDLAADEAARAREAMEVLASQGMRVLAFAARPADPGQRALAADGARRLTLLGLVGMLDPPRTEAIDAIRACQAAGVAVKMITGDHPVTAAAIGRELGILGADEEAVPGAALEGLDAAALGAAAAKGAVFARVAPAHKLRLVEALQASGHVVAMTGDGVNDAPALKRADIGVAMGITGTAAAKEAAKVVLADDNFASIAAAVEEGRRVYDNLVKALAFVLPTNLGIALILVAAMLLFPAVQVRAGDVLVEELLFPMSPTQILWINLVSSVTLSVPFAFEVLEPDAMRRPPRGKDAPIFSAFVVQRTLLVALLMAAGACGVFLWEYLRLTGALPGPITLAEHRLALSDAQTTAVTTVVCFQAFYLLECRSLRESAFRIGFFRNPAVFVGLGALLLLQCAFVYVPPLQALFGSTALDGRAWLEAILAGLVVVPVIHAEKRLRRRWRAAAARDADPAPAPA
ncbi:MAG: HAD-IC family P-type ATPase, partial [Planctomycetota bacterium]|nr:HAD-IC family P-type ATPase [Planctomycetota bacterium]